MNDICLALKDFTQRYCEKWQQTSGHWPESDAHTGIPSPCIIHTLQDSVYWQPQPFTPPADLSGVERALDISLQPDIQAFYTTQFAGDMPARFAATELVLLQAWSEDDFQRVQENLIGHLVTQRRLKLSPTLFIATTDDDREVVSLCNLTGAVLLEKIGTRKRQELCASLSEFLRVLTPRIL